MKYYFREYYHCSCKFKGVLFDWNSEFSFGVGLHLKNGEYCLNFPEGLILTNKTNFPFR